MDPKNQFASPYTGMGNNPVMMVDPDGELAFLAIVGIAAAIGGVSNWAANGADFTWEGLGHFGIGAGIGALAGATGGAVSGALGGSYGAMIAGGAASGAVSGGLNAGVYGGNVGAGIWQGALGGAIGGLVPSVGVNGIVPGAIVGAAGGALGGGLAGGTLSAINGGSFGSGFAQGARNGALGGALSGGVYGGISAANSKYERNIVFGNATKAGKQAFVNDLVREFDLAASVKSATLTDEFNGTTTNAETRPIINGSEQTFEFAMTNNHEGTMSNMYFKYRGRSLRAIASTFRHEMVHANDYFYGNVGNFYNSQTRLASWGTKAWAEIRGYRANIQYGYRKSVYTGELNKWLNAWQSRYGSPFPY